MTYALSLNSRISGYWLRSRWSLRPNSPFGRTSDTLCGYQKFWDRFIGKFIVTFELSEGEIPEEQWTF
jgi:hypothetical protein